MTSGISDPWYSAGSARLAQKTLQITADQAPLGGGVERRGEREAGF
jgi:hypothetical protein